MPLNQDPTQLMKVALGEAEADLAIVNGTIVNVYTGELLKGDNVLIQGDRVAYVGENAAQAIDAHTKVIDATGKFLIPGFIDGHTHIINGIYSMSELVRYAMKGGTTTIITEAGELGFPLGYRGVMEAVREVRHQPMKIFVVVPPMVTVSPSAHDHVLTAAEIRKLMRQKEIVGLGESFWGPVVEGDPAFLNQITEVRRAGKKVDGHTAGARDNKLQAYAAAGATSCHEPTTAEEVVERLRAGLYVLLREGETRRELESIIPKIKDAAIDFRRLILTTDGIGSWQLTADGYLDFIVQKAINLGLDPVRAIQMASLNVAQRFSLDDSIGGIAPGKYADILVIPDLTTIKPEYVISNGKVAVRNGEVLVPPKKNNYPGWMRHSVHLDRTFTADDFAVRVNSDRPQVKVRVIEQVAFLVTREVVMELPISNGQVQKDVNHDIIKVAAIERVYQPGQTFTGFIRGFGLKRGAMASSTAWDTTDMIVVGADEADMALAVNRIRELNGGILVCAGGKVLAELPLPIAGMVSELPMKNIADKLHQIQRAAVDLGFTSPDIRQTMCVLTTGGIPFIRISEQGLVDVRQNRLVGLIVE